MKCVVCLIFLQVQVNHFDFREIPILLKISGEVYNVRHLSSVVGVKELLEPLQKLKVVLQNRKKIYNIIIQRVILIGTWFLFQIQYENFLNLILKACIISEQILNNEALFVNQ